MPKVLNLLGPLWAALKCLQVAPSGAPKQACQLVCVCQHVSVCPAEPVWEQGGTWSVDGVELRVGNCCTSSLFDLLAVLLHDIMRCSAVLFNANKSQCQGMRHLYYTHEPPTLSVHAYESGSSRTPTVITA